MGGCCRCSLSIAAALTGCGPADSYIDIVDRDNYINGRRLPDVLGPMQQRVWRTIEPTASNGPERLKGLVIVAVRIYTDREQACVRGLASSAVPEWSCGVTIVAAPVTLTSS